MDNEVAPELIFDQGLGLYYPAVSDYYGYYYAGSEPLNEWDSQQQFFGQDPNIASMQTENLPNVYYIPSYGYVQSPYNPYNPSIPGALIGTEASFIETHYPTNPPHQLVVSSPAYIPVGIDSSSDTIPNSYLNPLLTSTGALPTTKPDSDNKKLPFAPQLAPINRSPAALVVASDHLTPNGFQASSSLSHTMPISVANTASAKQSSVGSFISNSAPGVNQQGVSQWSNLKAPPVYRPAKVTLPPGNGYTNYGSDLSQWTAGNAGDKFRPRFQISGPWVNKTGSLPEQNRGPRTDLAKCQWVSPLCVKAYTTKAGTINSEGNIIISADEYNREDFPIDYDDAKFFVIKSYSEDDVHKSIKYNVWSSTPSGNKRLDNAFEEAQKLSLGRQKKCPIFLFFSVNASGQFCGVAEITSSVDFQKNMDFWQQDKWLGSFPVKWHIIKDVSNTSLRHILLENNEYKPVTCSRDTQEIPFLQGMAMLRIFKKASLETSILDDFIHYEERQRILVEEKSRISGRRYNGQFFPSTFVPSKKVDTAIENETSVVAEEPDAREQHNVCDVTNLKADNQQVEIVKTASDENGASRASGEDPNAFSSCRPASKVMQSTGKPTDLVILGRSKDQFDNGVNSIMKIGSLFIGSKAGEEDPTIDSHNDVITVGSMHIKVGKHAPRPPGVVTVGSNPIDQNGL